MTETERMVNAASTPAAPMTEARETLPNGITLTRPFGSLQLRWDWTPKGRKWMVLPSAVFIPLMLAIAIWSRHREVTDTGQIVIALAAFVSGYVGLVRQFNRTTLTVTHHAVTVSHGPFPARRKVEIPASDIDQLYVRQTWIGDRPDPRIHYDVVVQRKMGKDVVLLKDISEQQHARWLERTIEDQLKIADRQIGSKKTFRTKGGFFT